MFFPCVFRYSFQGVDSVRSCIGVAAFASQVKKMVSQQFLEVFGAKRVNDIARHLRVSIPVVVMEQLELLADVDKQGCL